MSTAASADGDPPAGALTYAADIRPLFRAKDRDAMRRAFDLWQYDEVVSHAAAIASKLHEGTMPCDGAWPEAQLTTFDRWVSQGTPE